jgi:hypothetical protein
MNYPNQPYPKSVQVTINDKLDKLRFSETATKDDVAAKFRYLEGFLDALEIQYGYDSVTRVLLSTAVDAALNAANERSPSHTVSLLRTNPERVAVCLAANEAYDAGARFVASEFGHWESTQSTLRRCADFIREKMTTLGLSCITKCYGSENDEDPHPSCWMFVHVQDIHANPMTMFYCSKEEKLVIEL